MRVAGEAVAREAGIENGDLAAGAAELQGAGEAGKAAADDDDVIHGDGLRVVAGGEWAGLGGGLGVGETGGGKRGQRQQGSSLHGGLLVLWVGAISSSDTRSRRTASRASASARKSPMTVLTDRTMPHSCSSLGPRCRRCRCARNGNDKTAEACGQQGDACVRCSC